MMRGSVLLCVLLLGGCVAQDDQVHKAPPAPPPLVAETIPKPPVSEDLLIWEPGHWDWNGTGYVWAPGKFIKQAGHGSLWMGGHWETTNGTDVWVPAHWM